MKIKLSKSQWEKIGKKAGWMKVSQEYKHPIAKLINNDGVLLNKEGYAIEGSGIFDEDGKEYIAGIDKNGELYVSNVDEHNYVLDFQGNSLKQWNINQNYIELVR